MRLTPNHKSPDIFDIFFSVVFVLLILVLMSLPVSGYFKIKSLQRILNTECKGNYALIDVAFNGEELLKTCQIKNQSITIK